LNRFKQEGAEVVASSPEEYGAFLRADIEKWAKVIKQAGIRAE
jgi:tripartite-type tricarboxylate transporter receptor subunit TctC